MAEEYLIGTNRIVYRSTNFDVDLHVFVDLYRPNGLRVPSIILTEMGEGLYFFRYDFFDMGVYTGIFYEDGYKKTSQNFRILKKDVSSGSVIRPFLGDNVIGT